MNKLENNEMLNEFMSDICNIKNTEVKEIILKIVIKSLTTTKTQFRMNLWLFTKKDNKELTKNFFPKMYEINSWEDEYCCRVWLFSYLKIEFMCGFCKNHVHDDWSITKHNEDVFMFIPPYILDLEIKKTLKIYQTYFASNTIDINKKIIARIISVCFLDKKYSNDLWNLSSSELRIIINWLSPDEFQNLSFEEISKNLDIHVKMTDFIKSNTKTEKENILFSNIMLNLISNRWYHLWENLWLKDKIEMKEAIKIFYPEWFRVMDEDKDFKLWQCNRQRLSNFLKVDTFFCSQCSKYPMPIKHRYNQNEEIMTKLEELEENFLNANLNQKEYFITRIIVVHYLLNDLSQYNTTKVLWIKEDDLYYYLEKINFKNTK